MVVSEEVKPEGYTTNIINNKRVKRRNLLFLGIREGKQNIHICLTVRNYKCLGADPE